MSTTSIETADTWVGRLPSRSPETDPFWDACNRNVFLVQRCRTCRKTQYHYRAICAHCWSSDLEDIEASGRGKVWTYSVVRRNRSPVFAEKVPYVVALVELEEGVAVFGNIVECDPDVVTIDQDVTLAFTVAEDGQHIPVFRLAEAQPA
jgi:uncharacterized OB-fold protein